MRIVITAGGTSENIDGVRKITNSSTGKTGRSIAAKLVDKDHSVVFLHTSGVKPIEGASNITFEDFNSLENIFTEVLLSKPDWVVHAAAVSDYRLDKVLVNGLALEADEKIDSGQNLCLELSPTPKLIQKVKEISPSTKLFGFKFTNTSSPEKRLKQIGKIFTGSNADYVLHNDAKEKTETKHVYTIFKSQMTKVEAGETPEQLIESVIKCIEENL